MTLLLIALKHRHVSETSFLIKALLLFFHLFIYFQKKKKGIALSLRATSASGTMLLC